ncbi:MAG: 16S rRNA (cytosine(1402)-N(4))-methyltransferase [Legionellales bacterium]|nr:16S rRNA (cytosine(1402)-N(4))-methyltransferase [Legionellales bacterium]
MITEHKPVMLNEVLRSLAIQEDARVLDMTYGRGGHANAMLGLLGEQGRLVVVDCDASAIEHAEQHLSDDERITIHHEQHDAVVSKLIDEQFQFDSVLMDLGVSSPQLDDPTRGFSFRFDGPLDMRMDQRQPITAASWINNTDEQTMADCIWRYGDEKRSRKIAEAICNNRPVDSTQQLKNLIHGVKPRRAGQKIDPATKTFQAIRICINRELIQLEKTLPVILQLLRVGGRFAVITFQGHEQTILKNFIKRHKTPKRNKYQEISPPADHAILTVLERIKPSNDERLNNNRARSAQLTVMERVQ